MLSCFAILSLLKSSLVVPMRKNILPCCLLMTLSISTGGAGRVGREVVCSREGGKHLETNLSIVVCTTLRSINADLYNFFFILYIQKTGISVQSKLCLNILMFILIQWLLFHIYDPYVGSSHLLSGRWVQPNLTKQTFLLAPQSD